MRKSMFKKIFSILMVFVLVIGMIPKLGAKASSTKEEADKYIVNITGSANRFLYNEKTTDKGVVITYTVKEVTGTLSQNGVIGTTTPTVEYPYSGGGQMFYNEGVDPTMLEKGVTYVITIQKTAEEMKWSYVATTAEGQSHTVDLTRAAGTWKSESQYFGLWLCGAEAAKLTNVSCVELETGKDLGLASNSTTISIEAEEDASTVNEYTVNITGSANRFLYNNVATDKGVIITYTVEKFAGSYNQNGVIGTTTPTEEYAYSGGQMIYNDKVDPTMLEKGVTYQITIQKTAEEMKWSYVATTAEGEPHTVNLDWTAGAWNSSSQYFGLWMNGTLDVELTNVSCVELETGKDLGLASNSTTISIEAEEDDSTVNEYMVNITGSANRFLYNEKTTDKGVVITYTVKEVTGALSQNGVIGTTKPTEEYPYSSGGQMFYNEGVAPTMLEKGVTYVITIEKTAEEMKWSYVATTAEGQSHTVDLTRAAGTWKSESQYFGLWLCGALEAELTNVSCVELETGKDLGLASNSTTISIGTGTEEDGGDEGEEGGIEVNEYMVNITGSANRFLYNETATDKGVVITYTVDDITGSLGQNGVIGTTSPTEEYPYASGGQMIYNDKVAPTMLEKGVTYVITIQKTAEEMKWSYVATTADGETHTVNLDWVAGTWNSSSQYFGLWLCGTLEAQLTNVSCVELGTGKDLGLASNSTTISIGTGTEEDGGENGGDIEWEDKTEYILYITDSANRFLYNQKATDKGVVITYTVEEIAGSLSQNGVIGTTSPTEEYPYASGGQMIYNEGVGPTMLEKGVTYVITIQKTAEGMQWSYVATTDEGQSHTVDLTRTAGTWKSESQYFGLWLCGTLKAKLTNVSCVELGTGKDLGLSSNSNTISIGTEEDDEDIELKQKTPEQLGYTKVILKDFGLPDGKYLAGMGLQGGKYSGETLDGKYLDVNIENSAAAATTDESYINFAGNEPNGWLGIRFLTMEDCICVGPTVLWRVDMIQQIPLESVGVSSATEPYNMKMGVKVSGADVIVDVWINNIRVAPMTFKGQAQQFGNYIGVYATSTDITLSTPGTSNNTEGTKTEQLPSDFREFTFANVGIEDCTFGQNWVEGKYAFNFNKTIFSGDVLFDAGGKSDFRYGGKLSGWDGLRFWVTNGTLYMEEVQNHVEEDYAFSPIVAGVMFSKDQFNLKLSCEFVDSDADGKKDDVKLGVWFNDVLYDNSYIYLVDYTNHIGRNIFAYSWMDVESARMTVKSDKNTYVGVDYTVFGFTNNWRKEIGLR